MYRRRGMYPQQQQGSDPLAYQSVVDPNVMGAYANIMQQKDGQVRESMAGIAQAEAAYGAVPTVPGDRERYMAELEGMKEGINSLVQERYNGDIAMAAPEISRMIASKQGTFAQANRDHERWKQAVATADALDMEGQLGQKFNPATGQFEKINLDSLMNMSTYDEDGHYQGLPNFSEVVYRRGDHSTWIHKNISTALNNTSSPMYKLAESVFGPDFLAARQKKGFTMAEIDAMFEKPEFAEATVRNFINNSPQAMREFEGSGEADIAQYVKDTIKGQVAVDYSDTNHQDPALAAARARSGSDDLVDVSIERYNNTTENVGDISEALNMRNTGTPQQRLLADNIIRNGFEYVRDNLGEEYAKSLENFPDGSPELFNALSEMGFEFDTNAVGIAGAVLEEAANDVSNRTDPKIIAREKERMQSKYVNAVTESLGIPMRIQPVSDLDFWRDPFNTEALTKPLWILDSKTGTHIRVSKEIDDRNTLRTGTHRNSLTGPMEINPPEFTEEYKKFIEGLKGRRTEEFRDRYILINKEPNNQDKFIIEEGYKQAGKAYEHAKSPVYKEARTALNQSLKSPTTTQRESVHIGVNDSAFNAKLETTIKRLNPSSFDVTMTNYDGSNIELMKKYVEELKKGTSGIPEGLEFAGIFPATEFQPMQIGFRIKGTDGKSNNMIMLADKYVGNYMDPENIRKGAIFDIIKNLSNYTQLIDRELTYRTNLSEVDPNYTN